MHKNHLPGLLMAVLSSTTLFAQPDKKMVDEVLTDKKLAADTSKKDPWKFGGTLALNLNQQTSSYWIGSSEDFAFTVGATADLYGNMEKGRSHWDNTLKMAYGFQENESQGSRKTSDFIDLYSKYGVSINDSGTLAFSVLANIRTQFTDGYDYDQTPKRRTSGFFAPANILLTPGIDWRPKKYFSLFFSPAAAKWILVTNEPYSYVYQGGIKPDGTQEQPISEIYGVDPVRKVDFQFGAFLSASFNKELLKNVVYSSRLDLYANYLRNPGNIDVFWTNTLAFKLNKWLAITYQWNVAYDDDYVPTGESGPRTQFLGILGIGVTAKF
jgi:hypothetical protein